MGVLVKKEGFQTSSKMVDYHLSTTGILDIVGTCLFLLPVIGLVTPGANSLDDTTLFVQLSPEEKSAPVTNASPVTAH